MCAKVLFDQHFHCGHSNVECALLVLLLLEVLDGERSQIKFSRNFAKRLVNVAH